MRKVLGALCALLMLSGRALAADKGGPQVIEQVPVQSVSWNRTGPYVGLGLGYTVAEMEAQDFKFATSAFQGGIFTGYNVNLGNGFLIGLEADYWLGSISGQGSAAGYTLTASNQFMASIRGRAGVIAGPMLLYATAGPAFTERKAAIQTGPYVTDLKDIQTGLAVGGGIEAELTRTLFVRLEGMHYVFPDKDASGAAGFFRSADQQTSVRLGLGFKLN